MPKRTKTRGKTNDGIMNRNQSTTALNQELQELFAKVNNLLERKIKLLEQRLETQRSNTPDNDYIEFYY